MPSTVPSPCVNICRMDDGTGWCEGCLRSIDEIATWSLLDDGEKRAVIAELAQRRTVWAGRPSELSPPGARP